MTPTKVMIEDPLPVQYTAVFQPSPSVVCAFCKGHKRPAYCCINLVLFNDRLTLSFTAFDRDQLLPENFVSINPLRP